MHAKLRRCIVGKELAQGPYVAARVGFEPATFQMHGTEPTTEPPRRTVALVSWLGEL